MKVGKRDVKKRISKTMAIEITSICDWCNKSLIEGDEIYCITCVEELRTEIAELEEEKADLEQEKDDLEQAIEELEEERMKDK